MELIYIGDYGLPLATSIVVVWQLVYTSIQ